MWSTWSAPRSCRMWGSSVNIFLYSILYVGYDQLSITHAKCYSSKHRRVLMIECIILKTTPPYESDFFFMVNFKQHFKPNGSRNILCSEVVLCCCFDLLFAPPPSHRFVMSYQSFSLKCFKTYTTQQNYICLNLLSSKYEIHIFEDLISLPQGIPPLFTTILLKFPCEPFSIVPSHWNYCELIQPPPPICFDTYIQRVSNPWWKIFKYKCSSAKYETFKSLTPLKVLWCSLVVQSAKFRQLSRWLFIYIPCSSTFVNAVLS